MQHVYSTHVRDLHKTIHFTCKACMYCPLNIGVSSLIFRCTKRLPYLMYNGSLPATVYEFNSLLLNTVDLNGRCVVAEEIGDRDDAPLEIEMYKCAQCFHKPMDASKILYKSINSKNK